MRLEDHVEIERRVIQIWKSGELHFLKIVGAGDKYRAAVWVWDTYPGERHKGLPVYLSEYTGNYSSVKEAIEHYRSLGFRIQHVPHKIPKWMGQLKIEERLAKFMDEVP